MATFSVDSNIDSPRKTHKVSVALATYNGERFLRDQLDSIAQQTLSPYEVVVTDDGSSDRTLEIVREFASTVRFPVRIFSNTVRLGYADNFLRAATLCQGDLIAFCDQDDVWVKEKLELCAAAFVDDTVLLCVHNGYIWNGKETSGSFPDWGATLLNEPLSLDPRKFVPGFAMVFRSFLCHLLSNQERFQNTYTLQPAGHDQWIWFLATIGGRVAQTTKSLVYYRQHSTNTCGAPEPTTWRERMSLVLMEPPYKVLASAESKCAELAQAVSECDLPSEFRNNAKVAAQRLAKRSHLHRLRAEVYSTRGGVFKRLMGVIGILRLGGYSSKSGEHSFGPKALSKDLLLGIPGLRAKLSALLTR